MPFVKLDQALLTSSLWVGGSPELVVVWIYLLLASDGDGMVRQTLPAVAHGCKLSVPRAEEILAELAGPDPYSRTAAEGGRRLEIIRDPEFSIRLVNYSKYRQKDYTSVERKRRQRERERAASEDASRRDAVTNRDGHARIRIRRRIEKDIATTAPAVAAARGREAYSPGFEAWWVEWRSVTGKGTTKKQAWDVYRALPKADQVAGIDRLHEWAKRRGAARGAGAFVAEPPDAVRWWKNRRWEDEYEVEQQSPATLTDNELLVRDEIAHGSQPGWKRYESAVLAGERKPGTFDSFAVEAAP